MVVRRGRQSVGALFATAPAKLSRVLRGAGRAGGVVIADEAKGRSASDAVRTDVRVQTRAVDERVVTTIDVKPGWGRRVGTWLEYGTDPHFISVDDAVRGGRTVRRLNMLARDNGGNHSLVIGGRFVGATIFHPGARAEPWLRPALDHKEADALREAQRYIDARIDRRGIDDRGIEDDDA